MKYKYLLIISVFFFNLSLSVCDSAISSGPCQPYYASIKAARANSHAGPGKNYKISWEYIQRGVPVVITAKYDHWRKIQDPAGDISWVHKSLLSPKRFVITIKEGISQIRENSNDSAKIVADVKKNVVMNLLSARGSWCNVEVSYKGNKYIGWIKKEVVFGVFDNETS